MQEEAMNERATLLLVALVFLSPCSVTAAESGRSADVQAGSGPEMRVIEKWRGTWEVKSVRRAPQPVQEIQYVETFEWVLDGRFLRSQTSRKTDGGMSSSMFWFDVFTKTYRFVVFDAGGFALELPPPTWNEATQTMEWKSGSLSPTSYTAHATFSDGDTIRWRSLWKDWKGTAILELEGVSTRRK
uniref:DUF1579 domain-containing protein n=1 Tax=uncultured bacterium 888 TaxID=548896 RepID=B8R8Q4_9BACT|nr:hypothetical protein [uncultured bacterium 888]